MLKPRYEAACFIWCVKIALSKKMADELSVLYVCEVNNIKGFVPFTLVDSNKVVIFSLFTCFHAKWC